MKRFKLTNLMDVKKFIDENAKKKKDILVKGKDIKFNPVTREIEIDGFTRLKNGDKGDRVKTLLTPTDAAVGALYSRLGVPANYARRVPPELMVAHVHHWLEQIEDVELLVRATDMGGQGLLARAFMTSKYGILDNDSVVNAVINALDERDIEVKDLVMDDYGNNLNMRIIDKKFQAIGKDPRGNSNPYFAGMHIRNSEIGQGSVSAAALIWEQWCDNGAVRQRYGEKLLNRRHIGNSSVLFDAFNEAAEVAPIEYSKSMTSFQDSQSQGIENPHMALYNLMKSEKGIFTDSMKIAILDSYDGRAEQTRYGIASALTEAAQKSITYKERLDIEKVAGDILFFNRPLDQYGSEVTAEAEFKKIRDKVEKENERNNETGSN